MPPALHTYAVSALAEQPSGETVHRLHLIQATSQDAAEARVMAQIAAGGLALRGLLSRSCALTDEVSG